MNQPLSTAALLLIGTEITRGEISDTHGRTLSSLLTSYGIEVTTISIIPDGRHIQAEVGRLVDGVDLLVITGGLGPTSDDITREAVAAAAGKGLFFDEDSWEAIRRIYGGAGLPESNRRQAEIPEGFLPIPNSKGTAPGFSGAIGGCLVIAMPGPPRELTAMVESYLRPLLDEKSSLPSSATETGTSFLIPESGLEDYFRKTAADGDTWRTRAEFHRIVFEYRGKNSGTVDRMQEHFGSLLVRHGETSAAMALTDTLKSEGMLLVSAESCTGGLIGKMMTDLPGSSAVYWGGFVTYANAAKEEVLSVKSLEQHGAVSGETVREMALGALARSGADVAVSVSGVAGPEGGTPGKPVGTVWIGVAAREDGASAYRFAFRGSRERIRLRTAVCAMILTESLIKGVTVDNEPFRAYI